MSAPLRAAATKARCLRKARREQACAGFFISTISVGNISYCKGTRSPGGTPGNLQAWTPALPAEFADGLSTSSKAGEHHFGILAREDNSFGASFKSSSSGSKNVFGRGLLFMFAGWDIDIDAGIDFAFAFDIRQRSASFAENVIGGKAFGRKVFKRRFVGIIEPFVVKSLELVFGHVVENSGGDVINVIGVARPSAIVIDHDFKVIGDFGEFSVVLLGPEKRAE